MRQLIGCAVAWPGQCCRSVEGQRVPHPFETARVCSLFGWKGKKPTELFSIKVFVYLWALKRAQGGLCGCCGMRREGGERASPPLLCAVQNFFGGICWTFVVGVSPGSLIQLP